MNDNSELRSILVWALLCGIAYAVVGPVGLAVVALVALIRISKKEEPCLGLFLFIHFKNSKWK